MPMQRCRACALRGRDGSTKCGRARSHGQDDDSLRDSASIPPATDERPGILKVVIPFTDPEIVGRFVYHCHAVDHEDKGMMGTVLVVA
jgi:FtsP/CotA-like multicopper oxidase with cupredoxin domain